MSIDNNVRIATSVVIVASARKFEYVDVQSISQGHEAQEITIGNDV